VRYSIKKGEDRVYRTTQMYGILPKKGLGLQLFLFRLTNSVPLPFTLVLTLSTAEGKDTKALPGALRCSTSYGIRRDEWCNAPKMAHDGGSHDWELDELESMETVCMLLCAITIDLLPTHIPHSVGGSSCGRGDE
jgi:hypothetical protein